MLVIDACCERNEMAFINDKRIAIGENENSNKESSREQNVEFIEVSKV